jgi:hypothetical protein
VSQDKRSPERAVVFWIDSISARVERREGVDKVGAFDFFEGGLRIIGVRRHVDREFGRGSKWMGHLLLCASVLD